MAVISLDLSAVASWPSTRRWRAAQADTRWSGPRPLARSWQRRDVLPSMAMMSGCPSRSVSTHSAKQLLNSSASMPFITSLSVSWDGMPRSKGRKRRRNSSRASPQSLTSTKSSMPHSVAHSTTSRISRNGYSTRQPSRGSRRAAKCSRSEDDRGRGKDMDGSQHGKPSLNHIPSRRAAQPRPVNPKRSPCVRNEDRLRERLVHPKRCDETTLRAGPLLSRALAEAIRHGGWFRRRPRAPGWSGRPRVGARRADSGDGRPMPGCLIPG